MFLLFLFSNYLFGQDTLVVNALESQNKNISGEQANLIYEHCKAFPNNTQLSIAFLKNGVVEFVGIKRSNDTIIACDNHQGVFEIGSITKVFTATLLANFASKKEINLTDNINKNLDYELASNEKISWLNLANHTAGLPRLPSNLNLLAIDPQNPYKNYGEKELVEYLSKKMELEQKPNEKYAYSNLSAGLISYLLTKQFDTTYEALLSQHIFSKYDMNHSTTNRKVAENQLIQGLDFSGQPTANWDMNILEGAGAILSTAEDLSKFALAHFDKANKELTLTRQSTFSINENMDIGLGWHLLKKQATTTWYWHNGGTGGYTSSITLDPKNKNAVIILSNVSAFHQNLGNIDLLCFALMNTLSE